MVFSAHDRNLIHTYSLIIVIGQVSARDLFTDQFTGIEQARILNLLTDTKRMTMLKTLITKGYVEGGCITSRNQQVINIAELPPILRTLLVTDGTVTKTLEAFFWEPIGITPQQQQLITLNEPLKDLGCSANSKVLQRDVIIAGQHTHQIYTTASSLLNIEPLPEKVQQQLIAGEIGIGELLRDQGLETFRQVIDIFAQSRTTNAQSANQGDNVANAADVASVLPCDEDILAESSTVDICRTYLIFYHNQPVIQVTEKFPLDFYRSI